MTDQMTDTTKTSSPLHAFLSFVIPGLGQTVAGFWQRGLTILLSILGLGALSAWTIAQEARFPDFNAGLKIFGVLLLQSIALLIFILALQRVLYRYVIKNNVTKAFGRYVVGLIYTLLVILLAGAFLDLASQVGDINEIYQMTAILAAGGMAAIWLWQAADAGKLPLLKEKEKSPSILSLVLLISTVILFLGSSVTEIDMAKAVSEYKDTRVILTRIVWPWRNAFEYQIDAVEVVQKIQSPCPEGATGPASNEPDPTEAWISTNITCGDLTEQDLQGNTTYGTELTITGGNFTPGVIIELEWKNPIGNAFTPRGVGETLIEIGPDGTFESTLIIPQVTIVSTAVGDQVHQLIAIEESEEVFTGRLSAEMKLALFGILESIMIGLMATFFGIMLAFPVSFLAARNLMGPIVQPISEVVGAMMGIVTSLAIALFTTGQIINAIGGLEKAPIIIFIIFLILTIGLSVFGVGYGTKLATKILKLSGDLPSKLFTTLGLVTAGGVLGYLAGLWFSRGILSIPYSVEVAAQSESMFALGGAILVGVLGLFFGMRLDPRKEFGIGMAIYSSVRTVLNIIRSIEPLIWGIVAIIWVGPGPFAGTIALTLHTIAALGKLYSESIESIDPGPIEALQATGANRLQTIVYAVIPQILPPFISFTIYRWDINVRMSTIIGMVGGGGIGFILIQWIRLFQYGNAGLAVWLITITVAAMDYISSNIRERYT